MDSLDGNKYKIPENWPFEQARILFKSPEVSEASTLDLKWKEPDEQGIVDFLVTEKQFNEERVRKAVQKFSKCRNTATQGRLDSFFKVLPSTGTNSSADKKRKVIYFLV